MQTLIISITTTNKLLDYKADTKSGLRNGEDAQGGKYEGKNMKKDKGNFQTSRKTSKDKAKKADTPTDKGKHVLCWICAKDNYAKNYPLKQKLSAIDQVDKLSVGLFQVLGVVFEEGPGPK
jgi:hypothetical protein